MIIASLLLAALQTFTLEVDSTSREPVGRVVGEDGVRREVRLMLPEEYAALTNKAFDTWRKLNETPAGRLKLHGPIVTTEFPYGKRIQVHADGYRYTEMAGPSNVRKHVSKAVKSKAVPRRPQTPMSERHRKFIEELEKNKNKTVTVIHDAVTGKDRIVE